MSILLEKSLTIERLGIHGEGVGYWEGFTVFIEGALPGEEVIFEFYEKRKRYGRAKVVKFLTTSPYRVKPPCPLFGECGGCQFMHLEYSQQLVAKRQRVVDALERIGKFEGVAVLPCAPSEATLAYRNKIQLPVQNRGNSSLVMGLYAQDSHRLIEVEQCGIHCALGEKVYQHIQRIIKASSLTAYDATEGSGELRHVLIKTAVFTNQVLVVLVTSQEAPSIALKAAAQQIMLEVEEVRGVVHNYNPVQGNVILGSEYRTICGQGAIEEVLCGLKFKVSPASFFQVNPAQAEKLYARVAEYCALTGNETLLDAYCGVGTLSLILAKMAKEVIGVECVAAAIEDARENAVRNSMSNVRFECALAETFIPSLKAIDVAVINPPRKGCEPSFLEGLAKLGPKRIVYISCDPATLARDLRILCDQGYCIDKVEPFDMFPQTAHVETLVSLTRSS